MLLDFFDEIFDPYRMLASKTLCSRFILANVSADMWKLFREPRDGSSKKVSRVPISALAVGWVGGEAGIIKGDGVWVSIGSIHDSFVSVVVCILEYM